MDKNEVKTKNSRGLVVILIIIVLGIGSFILYDKFILNSNENNCTTKSEKTIENKTKNIDIDDVYNKYLNNISKRDNIKSVSIIGPGSEGLQTITYYLGSDNVVYTQNGNEDVIIPPQEGDSPMVFTGTKTNLTEVADIFAVSFGNGGFYKLYVLKKDGILYDVDLNNNYKITPTNYKNVVIINQISDADASSFEIVDINGNKLNKD